MNKQRKVLITTTYNEMGVVIDTKAEEVQLATDIVSRQAAIDDIWTVSPLAHLDREWIDRWLRQLPPAQPERIRGRWTRDNACSECGCQPWFSGDIHNYNFCPNCGADMREVTT